MVGPEEPGSSVRLSDFVGSAFGDFTETSETPETVETPGDAAGAPPAELPTADPAPETPPPDGTAPDAHAGAPPADAAVLPDAGAPPAVVDADPLASAMPLTYTVHGDVRTYDGIKVLGEDGAVIAATALQDLQRRLGERDHLYETSKAQHETVQQYERLSSWATTDAAGKETTLTGREGLVEMRVQLASLAVENAALASVFADPQKLLGFLTNDADGKLILNTEALRTLALEARHNQREAVDAVRAHLQTLAAPAATSAAPALDVAALAPSVIAAAAGAQAAHLTPEDTAFLAGQLARYLRTVTEADRKADLTLTLGGPIVDASFKALVQRTATANAAAKHTAVATTDAATRNAAVLAAAARTTKPVAAPAAAARAIPRPPSPQSQVASDRATDADAGFDLMQTLISPRRATA